MMSSNGPPTPKGVGGPTPSLVSKGSEEEGGTRIPTGGFPSLDRKGEPTSPPQDGEEASAPKMERGGLFRNQKGDEEPPPTQRGREGTFRPQGRVQDHREGRGENREEKEECQQNRPEKSTQRTHTSRELRMLDPSDKPPPKRARRPTRRMTIDN